MFISKGPFWKKRQGFAVALATLVAVAMSCGQTQRRAEELFATHCTSCHLPTPPEDLTKKIWDEAVLPEMAARLGIAEPGYDPYATLSMEEAFFVRQVGLYPTKPAIKQQDWDILRAYILDNASDTLADLPASSIARLESELFSAELTISNAERLSSVTSITYDSAKASWWIGEATGELTTWPGDQRKPVQVRSCIVAQSSSGTDLYLTEIGSMGPSQVSNGALFRLHGDSLSTVMENLHRPVYSEVTDLNRDGLSELVISEFGHHTGQLSLLMPGRTPEKRTLLNFPGCVKFEILDMNGDDLLDIVALTTQAWEGIHILYQQDDMTFSDDYVVRLPPHYGSSWFEIEDIDRDGDMDFLLVNGDNADLSQILKPYHGVRLYRNAGNNKFSEDLFYPVHGATRILAEDFDLDGDTDLGILAFFPDLSNAPEQGFILLENTDAASLQFQASHIPLTGTGRWLVMDKGDPDGDGDSDLLLGAYLLPRQEAYLEMLGALKEANANLLFLENRTR